MPAVYTDNLWLAWCGDVPELQVLKQLKPQRAAFGETVYQLFTRRPTFDHRRILFWEQTLRLPGNGVTNMHSTVDRNSKHKIDKT